MEENNSSFILKCSKEAAKGGFMKKALLALCPLFVACSMTDVNSTNQTIAANDTPSYSSFMEENDLWKEDDLNAKGGITESEFRKVIDLGLKFYTPLAERNNESLKIKPNWDDSTVNANCSRFFGSVTINMYGGLARRDEVNIDGFALVLCHELGHAYGGTPYISEWNKMSAEGQSDFYGARECLKKIIPELTGKDESYVEGYIETKCGEVYGVNTTNYSICLKQLSAAQSLGNLLAYVKEEPQPNFETPDPTVVKETLTSYPETIQCRLDTYHNGALQLNRPACWFKN